jgi:hypothetical protein
MMSKKRTQNSYKNSRVGDTTVHYTDDFFHQIMATVEVDRETEVKT